jgi:uncharacterized protein
MKEINHQLTACVVKIASRCNLNCGYCYIYNKGDESFKGQPKFLSESTVDYFLKKMDSYLVGYPHNSFSFVFHGGEPLLADKTLYAYFIKNNTAIFEKHNIKPIFCIQTNGVLIDSEWVGFFKQYDIHVGISIDSTKKSNDSNRVYHNGKSSYKEILNGFNTYRNLTGHSPGILSVIDLNQDPEEVYAHYKSINAAYINLLFPDDTHNDNFIDDLKLGKWLFSIFKMWLNGKEVRIDQFEVLLSIIYGADFIGDEYYGTKLNNTFILETDGELQANDPLRVCIPNIHKTKFNVEKNEIMDLLKNPLAELYYNSKERLCNKCKNCQLSDICSGGYLINRFSNLNGFDNPSIYCKSLAYLITNVQNMAADFSNQHISDDEKIVPLNLEEILNHCESNDYAETYELSKFKVEDSNVKIGIM